MSTLIILCFCMCTLVVVVSQTPPLSKNFYNISCPSLFGTVNEVIQSEVVVKEKRMGASLLRLFFHDCFVNGCDGSVLLDDTPTFTGEKTAAPNLNSARGFQVIDLIKAAVERNCPNVVSCADLLAIAARDSVAALGGPFWEPKLGRRDSTTASFEDANSDLPGPSFNLTQLLSRFQELGFSPTDLVALSGAHTIGQARCATFRARIYNDTDIDESFAESLKLTCPETPGQGDDNLAGLDDSSAPIQFDVSYYSNLKVERGLLHSDQQIYSVQDITSPIVDQFAGNRTAFFAAFIAAMIKMGDLNPLTGSKGEIRVNCSLVNPTA